MDDGNGLPIRNASLEDVHILASAAQFHIALGKAPSGIPANGTVVVTAENFLQRLLKQDLRLQSVPIRKPKPTPGTNDEQAALGAWQKESGNHER